MRWWTPRWNFREGKRPSIALRRGAVRRAAQPEISDGDGGGASAERDLQLNAPAVHREQARVEDYMTKLQAAPDFILADPPRAGLGKAVVPHLNRLAPARVTIVSCDPATLARDVAALTAYKIERLTLMDLFPQTYHIEAIAELVDFRLLIVLMCVCGTLSRTVLAPTEIPVGANRAFAGGPFFIWLLRSRRGKSVGFSACRTVLDTIFFTIFRRPRETDSPGRAAIVFPIFGAILGAAGAALYLAAGAALPSTVAALMVVALWTAIARVPREDGRIEIAGMAALAFSVMARWLAIEHLATERLLAVMITSRSDSIVGTVLYFVQRMLPAGISARCRAAAYAVTGPNGSREDDAAPDLRRPRAADGGDDRAQRDARAGWLPRPRAAHLRELTALENLDLYGRLCGVPGRRERIGMLLERFGLWEAARPRRRILARYNTAARPLSRPAPRARNCSCSTSRTARSTRPARRSSTSSSPTPRRERARSCSLRTTRRASSPSPERALALAT